MGNSDVWAIIPARGGSKSIPLKNMKDLGGVPLIEYSIALAKRIPEISRIVCSTDHDGIGDYCLSRQIEVAARPTDLAGDDIATLDVLVDFLKTQVEKHDVLPELLVLFEPTSPFVQRAQVQDCIALMRANRHASSVQTLVEPPPNHHAFNQRFFDGELVKFRYPAERENRFNKQRKPKFYVHGNLRVLRCDALLRSNDLFGNQSLGVIIPKRFALDVDGPEDFEVAEMYLASGFVTLD